MKGRPAHRISLRASVAALAALGVLVPTSALAQSSDNPYAPTPAPTQPAQPAQPPQAAQPPPSPYDPSMQAGGLTPPPPMDPNAPSTTTIVTPPPPDTEDDLDEAKKKDSKRGLSFVWLDVEGGYDYVNLQLFNIDEQNFTAGFVETIDSGAAAGAGVGVQLLFLTLGARGRVGFFSQWQIFSVGGELGFRIPIGKLEPHIDLGGGYAALGNVQGAVQGAADAISIHGFYVRAGAGLDYYPTSILSIGVNASAEVLGLTRPGISFDEVAKIKSDPSLSQVQRANADLLQLEGSGYGLGFTATGVIGLHF